MIAPQDIIVAASCTGTSCRLTVSTSFAHPAVTRSRADAPAGEPDPVSS